MRRIGWLVLILGLSLLALTGCSQLGQATPSAFDALARWVPVDADGPFFLDLKPDGDAGRRWERIRGHMEANSTGQEVLRSIYSQFKAEEYGLDEFIAGPAVTGYARGATYVILQVSDEEAVQNALSQQIEDGTGQQEEYEGKTLYYGRYRLSPPGQRLAWTIHDGLLFLCYSSSYGQDTLTLLKDTVSLTQADSLAALPAWQTLRDRLPEAPMGLIFANVAEQTGGASASGSDTSLGTALSQQIVAMALAAVPEDEGMRVEIAGLVALDPDTSPDVRALFDLLSPIDPAAWTGLPSDTAVALVAHDAHAHWPWLREFFFNPDALAQLRDSVGLDLEKDLAGPDGPLRSDFAVAISPPLPGQPISQGVPAGQLLILAHGTSQAQMADVQAAMESRGAVFGPGEVSGVALQTQVGTELSGYAIAYGFADDTLLFGSSPGIIGQGVAAQREDKGLVTTPCFRAMLAALPEDPSLLFYLNTRLLSSLLQTNMTEEQYQRPEYLLLELFEAIGLGLRLRPDRLDGVLYLDFCSTLTTEYPSS
jgi:hypothetical protein